MKRLASRQADAELRRNIIAYREREAELEREFRGKFAVFSSGQLQTICENSDDAYEYARKNLTIGNFAIKEIGAPPVHFGAMNGMLANIDLNDAA